MSEGRLTFVYRHHPQPGRLTLVQELGTGICAVHEDPVVALREFDSIWAGRSPYQLIEHAPPRQRRADDPKPASAAVGGSQPTEGDSLAVVFHRALLRALHSDHHGHRSYSSDEIVAIVNRLWHEVTAK